MQLSKMTTFRAPALAAISLWACVNGALANPPAAAVPASAPAVATGPASVGPAMMPGAPGAVSGARPITSTSVAAVAIGTQSTMAAQAKRSMGTIAELEELQRQTVLADARKRLQELAPTPKAQEAEPQVTGVSVPEATRGVPKAARKAGRGADALPTLPSAAELMEMERSTIPKTKVVSLLMVGGRARADVLENERVWTVREGDMLGAWMITQINAAGVMVEYREAPVSAQVKDGAARSFPAAFALLSTAREQADSGKVLTHKLPSASPQELAAVIGYASSVGSQVHATAVQKPTAAAAPMLDSTSIPPLPKIPGAPVMAPKVVQANMTPPPHLLPPVADGR